MVQHNANRQNYEQHLPYDMQANILHQIDRRDQGYVRAAHSVNTTEDRVQQHMPKRNLRTHSQLGVGAWTTGGPEASHINAHTNVRTEAARSGGVEEGLPACKALFTAGRTCARLLVGYIELEVVCHARRAALLAATLCSVQVLLHACTKAM